MNGYFTPDMSTAPLDGPCREYRGWYVGPKRYGYVPFGPEGYRRPVRLNRWIWEQFYGPIPPGMVIMHLCDNPPCFRLSHLKAGSQADNAADRDAKGRTSRGLGFVGSDHPRAKLTEAMVQTIRLRAQGGEAQRALAREYGVSQRAVSFLLKRETWSHVP